jgi:hypothetical protein
MAGSTGRNRQTSPTRPGSRNRSRALTLFSRRHHAFQPPSESP